MKLPLKSNYKKIKKTFKEKPLVLFPLILIAGFLLGATIGKTNYLSKVIGSRVDFTVETISPKALNKALEKKDFTFINVHTPYEGEIAGTDLFLEHDLVRTNKDKLPEDKDARIILYCRSGNMSAQALKTLKSMGYTNVVHLDGGMNAWEKEGYDLLNLASLPEKVVPSEGIILPIKWGDIGPRLIAIGAIDLEKFEKATNLKEEEEKILKEGSSDNIKITNENSHFIVNMLWALGLAQKSKVYDEGPMGKEYKEDAGNFASTGGWTLAKSDALNYLNKFELISLDNEEQERVYEIASKVYRPCCGNSTAFPDCNHGMAALGAIELMVASGLSDEEIYKSLLALNSYWFPSSYLTTATYFARQGVSWDKVDPEEVLGQEYSSAQGAGKLYKQVGPLPYGSQGGGSCGA